MGVMYKKSQFNYIVHFEKGCLIYNTLYNSLSRLSTEEYKQMCSLSFHTEQLQNALAKQGIIVKNDVDELKVYNIYSALAMKFQNATPNITIAPTMECNARCFYCYEEGVRCGSMDITDADKIIDLIRSIDTSRGITLTWFGGEPLMNQPWIDYFSGRLKAENIHFSAFMISNGSMIDDTVVEKMVQDWNVTSIQITFDGADDEYCRRKAYIDQDENIYYQMFRKIAQIAKAGISVQIRLNIDRNNVGSILELAKDIQMLFSGESRVHFYPAFLTGNKNPLSEHEKIEIIKKILKIDETQKLQMENLWFKIPKSYACYINQKNAYSVDANGDIFICERLLGHSDCAVGNIDNVKEFPAVERTYSGQRSECQKCVFLPKCHGGCQNALINGETPCFIDKYLIKAYMEILQEENKYISTDEKK